MRIYTFWKDGEADVWKETMLSVQEQYKSNAKKELELTATHNSQK